MRKSKSSKASVKLRYRCLMNWIKERAIVQKPPKKETETSLKYELDLLTKPYKEKQKWQSKQRR